MTEHLSMNRIIHAAVRRDVDRTEQALRALPEGDTARAGQVRLAWRNLGRELTHHHEAEDEHVWPFLQSRGVDLALLEEMESEHVDGHFDHEEREVEGPLGVLHHDEEFKALTKKLRPASPVDAANALAWMQDGAGERERTSLRATIPGPLITILTRLLARRYRREIAGPTPSGVVVWRLATPPPARAGTAPS